MCAGSRRDDLRRLSDEFQSQALVEADWRLRQDGLTGRIEDPVTERSEGTRGLDNLESHRPEGGRTPPSSTSSTVA